MASITKRGNSYRISVSNGRDANGKQIIETTTFVPDPERTERQNKKALELFALEFEQKVKSGKYLDGEKLTFQAFSDIWMKDYAEQHLEDKTLQLYRHMLRLHILPVIGHLKLAKVQPTHLTKLYNTLSTERKDGKEGGYAPKTIKHIHNIISGIYTTAIKWNIVIENPCERVTPPKLTPARDKIKYFTLEQTEQFLQLLNEDCLDNCVIPIQFKLFFHMAVFCGMRRGELVALEWSDLDFTDNSVSISKSTTTVNGKPLTKQPKTTTSTRVISVPASVMEIAKEYRKEQLQYQLSIGSQWIGTNYVFIQWNGAQMYPDTPYRTFKRIIKRYNATADEPLPEIPLHGLRHTSATLLISQNIDVRTVSGRLGHAKPSTTMDIYSHALKKMDEKASTTLENLFQPSKKKTLTKC